MPVTVHFRGVALLVANKTPGVVTEILFPQTHGTPKEGSETTLTNAQGQAIKVKRHADDSLAHRHYAGALIADVNDNMVNRLDLHGRTVTISQAGSNGATLRNDADKLPYLNQIILPEKRLKLLRGDDNPFIETRFVVRGGTIDVTNDSGEDWEFNEANGRRSSRPLNLESTWTLPEATVIFEASGGGRPTERFELNERTPHVYFYNYDEPYPDIAKLVETKAVAAGTVDHDFKWIYSLLASVKAGETLKQWLNGSNFPAPVCVKRAPAGGAQLLTVSTCFEGVWDGETEPQ